MSVFPKDIPVVIIGAGPCGLTTGLLLAAYGVRSVVLEAMAAPLPIPRAIILDDEGARTLQCFGADETYVAGTFQADGAAYIDDDGVEFGRVGSGAETYGFAKRHFISQPEMEAALHDRVAQTPLCEVFFDSEVLDFVQSDDGVVVTVGTPSGPPLQIAARYVVAADGGRSPTREALGIQMSGATYSQVWIVIDTANDPDKVRYSKFFCSVERPHVAVPAPNGGKRYEFMLLDGETHEQVLEESFVRDLLARYRDIAPKDIIRKVVYTFHARIAAQFRAGRVLLAGDAAHLTPPFAGQGMNAGLRDASNISWKLAAILNGGASDRILESYSEERHGPAWAMIQLAVAMGDIVMPIAPEQQAFRAQLLTSIAPFPGVQDYLLKMKFKPPPRYDQGVFLDLHDQPFEASLVGEMIPQPDVAQGGKTTKLDGLLGNGFALIAQDQAGVDALCALQERSFAGLPLGTLCLETGAPFHAKGLAQATTKDPRAKPLRTHRDQLMLIRPDRYCAAAFAPSDLIKALATYGNLLGIQPQNRG